MLGNTRYDVILRTLWHKDVKPIAEYDQRIVRTGDLIIKGNEYSPKGSDVCDMSLKQFRKILRKKGN